MSFFFKNLSIYIANLDLFEIKKNTTLLSNLRTKLEKISDLIDIKIMITFTLIEFSDGVYNMKNNIFYKRQTILKNINKYQNLATFKYCGQSFKNLNTPTV